MAYRLNAERGRYSSCRLILALAVMALLPAGAWAQKATDAEAVEKSPPKKLNLYTGQAQELLSDTRWQNLLAMQPLPEPEATSDSRDWSNTTDPVVKVEGERTGPEVPSGIAGLFWALRHPTQAWRVFAPAK